MFAQRSFKPYFIQQCGFDVYSPNLSNWSIQSASKAAQEAYDEFKPDIVVGSSRGGAIAMSINTGDTPLILLSPAWKMFGNATKTKPKTIVIHSKQDQMVPYEESVELCKNSGCFLLTAGADHRMNDTHGRLALAWALKKLETMCR